MEHLTIDKISKLMMESEVEAISRMVYSYAKDRVEKEHLFCCLSDKDNKHYQAYNLKVLEMVLQNTLDRVSDELYDAEANNKEIEEDQK